MIETNRLRIYPASREQMEAFIAAEADAELKKAYTEMLEGCLRHPNQWEWYSMWMIELRDGTHIGDLCFKGFGENIYLSFEIERENASKASNMVNIYTINGQNFSNIFEEDVNGPSVRVDGSFERKYNVGNTVAIPKAIASDVLSDVVGVTVTVTLNGVAVKDINNVVLENVSADREYQILLNSIGEYKISYKAKDSRGAESVPKDYIIRGVVEQNPVINVSSELQKTAKVGEEIVLPEFTVMFAEENANNLSYAVYITPSNEYVYINDGKMTVQEEGVYKVRYFALDAYGNYSIWESTIKVTK